MNSSNSIHVRQDHASELLGPPQPGVVRVEPHEHPSISHCGEQGGAKGLGDSASTEGVDFESEARMSNGLPDSDRVEWTLAKDNCWRRDNASAAEATALSRHTLVRRVESTRSPSVKVLTLRSTEIITASVVNNLSLLVVERDEYPELSYPVP